MRLDKLFRVVDDVVLPDGSIVSVRVLSDTEVRIRANECDRASDKVVKSLKPGGELHELKMKPLEDDATDSELVQLLVAVRSLGVGREAAASIEPRVFPMPENPSDEEISNITLEREKENERVESERTKYVDAAVDKYRKELAGLNRDALLVRVKNIIYVPDEYQARKEAWEAWTIHLSTERAISVNDAREMHPAVKKALLDKYRELDNIDPFSLSTQS